MSLAEILAILEPLLMDAPELIADVEALLGKVKASQAPLAPEVLAMTQPGADRLMAK